MRNKKKILTEELINYSLLATYVQNLEQNYLNLFVKILKRDETKTKDVEKLFPESTETIEEILTSLGRQSGTRELLIVTKEKISAKIPKVKALVKKMKSYLALLDAMGKIQKQINPQKKPDQDNPAVGLIKTITQLFENEDAEPDLTAVEQKVLEFFESEENQEKLKKLKNIGSPLEDASEALALISDTGAKGLAKEIKLISAYMDHGAKLKNTIKLRLSDDVADIEDAEPETPEEFVASLDLDEEGKETLNAFKEFAKNYKPDLQEADDDPTTLLSKFGISQNMYDVFIDQSGTDKENFLRILKSLNDKGKAPKFKKFIVTPQESTEDSKKASSNLIKNFLNLATEQIKLIQQDPPLIISTEEGVELDQIIKTEIDKIYLEGNQFFQSVQDNEELMQVLLLLNSNNIKKLNQKLLKTSESKVREYYATIKDLYKEKDEEQKTDLQRLYNYTIENEKEVMGFFKIGEEEYKKTWNQLQNAIETSNAQERHTTYNTFHSFIKKTKKELLKYFYGDQSDDPQGPPAEEPEPEEEEEEGNWDDSSEEFIFDFAEEVAEEVVEAEPENTEEAEAAAEKVEPENSNIGIEEQEIVRENVVTVVTTLNDYFDFLKKYIKGSAKTTQQEGIVNKLLRVTGRDVFDQFFKQLAKYLESDPDRQKVAGQIKTKWLEANPGINDTKFVDVLKDLWLQGNFAEKEEKGKVIDAYKIPIFSKSKITGMIIRDKFQANFGAYMNRKWLFVKMIKQFTSAKDSSGSYGGYFFKTARERTDSNKATAYPNKFLNALYKKIASLKDESFAELSQEEKKEIQTDIDKLVADAEKIKDEGLQHERDKKIQLITPVKVFEEQLQEQIIKLIKPYLLKRMKTKRIGATR